MVAASSPPATFAAPAASGRVRKVSSDVLRQKVGWGVQQAELRREDLTLIDGGQVMVLASALGPPRIWGYLLDSALDAFTDAYLRTTEGAPSVRLHQGMRLATHYVRERIESLIERRGADASLLAIALDGPILHVQSVGALDAYLYRRKSLRRLGATQPEGMLKGTASPFHVQVEPGDVLFAGSRAVCHPGVLQRLSFALEQDRTLSTRVIVETLRGAAEELGVGAATLALRVPGG